MTQIALLEDLCSQAKSLHRSADERICAIYAERAPWSALQSARQEKLRGVYTLLNGYPDLHAAWIRLLNHIGYDTPLLSIEPAIRRLGTQPGNTLIDGLLMLVLRQAQWVRPVELWLPDSDGLMDQFASLARHLFARYPVPDFLNACWFEGFSSDAVMYQEWYVHIGSGQNIRRSRLPLRLTEKAAHYFLLAPSGASLVGALRYGQLLALGADPYLAQAVQESRLGALLPDEPFWESVLQFFANQSDLRLSDVGPIVDFIYTRRFGTAPLDRTSDSLFACDGVEPTFSMKGRTLPAMLRRVAEWHEQLARDNRRSKSVWQPSGIPSFLHDAVDSYSVMQTWIVREMLTTQELLEEGREQKHCVFSYGAQCLNGACSIWSLRVRSAHNPRWQRLLTIEVNNARRAIVQVRGKCNKTLGASRRSERMRTAGEMLRRWAQEARLSIACGV